MNEIRVRFKQRDPSTDNTVWKLSKQGMDVVVQQKTLTNQWSDVPVVFDADMTTKLGPFPPGTPVTPP